MVGSGWKIFVWQLNSVFAFKNFYYAFDTQLAKNENTFELFSLGFSYCSKDRWQFCNFLHKLTGGILVIKHIIFLLFWHFQWPWRSHLLHFASSSNSHQISFMKVRSRLRWVNNQIYAWSESSSSSILFSPSSSSLVSSVFLLYIKFWRKFVDVKCVELWRENWGLEVGAKAGGWGSGELTPIRVELEELWKWSELRRESESCEEIGISEAHSQTGCWGLYHCVGSGEEMCVWGGYLLWREIMMW